MSRYPHRRILGEAIRRRRKGRGLSQEALAEKSNLSAVYISQVERGLGNVSVDALARIARALEERIGELFEGI